jgi:CRP/FNR family transcriptional regulator
MGFENRMAIDLARRAAAPRPSLVIEPGYRKIDPCAQCGARAISVCAAIEDADLERLAAAAVITVVEPGRAFIGEGEPADDFFNVTSGTAKLYKLLPDGRRQITGFAGRGDFLGLAARSVFAFSAEAVEPMRLCRFSRRKLLALLTDFPALERRLLTTASDELVAAQEQMLLLGRKTARERLATFLLARWRRHPSCAHGEDRLTLPMSRGDIADYLGLTIETISRGFGKLKAERLIEVPDLGHVVIRDPTGLARLAEGYAGEP